jgi:ribosomal protein L34E
LKTNWKKLVNPEYLGAYSLDDGNGKYNDIIATIQRVVVENVTGPDGKKEDCAVAYFSERGIKPMILNVTNMKTLEKLFKSKYIEDWSGRSIQIGVDKVKAFGDVVDALRIRNKIPVHAGQAPKCSDCGEAVQSVGGKPPAVIAKYTSEKYGRPLCGKCAEKAATAADPLAATETIPEGVELL